MNHAKVRKIQRSRRRGQAMLEYSIINWLLIVALVIGATVKIRWEECGEPELRPERHRPHALGVPGLLRLVLLRPEHALPVSERVPAAPLGLRLVHACVFLGLASLAVRAALPEWDQLQQQLARSYLVGEGVRPGVLAAGLTAGISGLAIVLALLRRRSAHPSSVPRSASPSRGAVSSSASPRCARR